MLSKEDARKRKLRRSKQNQCRPNTASLSLLARQKYKIIHGRNVDENHIQPNVADSPRLAIIKSSNRILAVEKSDRTPSGLH
jgi:hypothetical protein